MKRIKHVLAKIFPVPDPGEKMTAGERTLLGGIVVLGLGAAIYFTADWGPGYYWGNYSLFGHLNFYCPAISPSLLYWGLQKLFVLF